MQRVITPNADLWPNSAVPDGYHEAADLLFTMGGCVLQLTLGPSRAIGCKFDPDPDC
jgi:hypothetical protein